jgi:carboxyl-terminal processing protease
MNELRPAEPYWAPPSEPLPPKGRPALAIAGLLLLAVVFALGVAVGQSGLLGTPGSGGLPVGPQASGAVAQATQPPDAPSDFGLFWQAYELIQKNYVGRSDLSDQTITYGAISGMMQALGDTDHSVFLTPQEVQASQNALGGSVVGVGVLLGQRNGSVVVLQVVDNGPAGQAGMRAGDVIVAVDGQSVVGQDSGQIADQVRGQAGSSVKITVQRPSTGETLDFNIVRAEVHFPAASWAMVPGTRVALLNLIEFSTGSADELRQARDQAVAAGAQSLILDLRGNPGGYVDQAVDVASLFLKDKTVYIRELADNQRIPVATNNDYPATDLPMAVLIDGNTASSAEIVAGALESAGRGPVIGQTTFGTGTILLTYPLADGSAIRLAVERWLTPDGQLIFGHGITPTQTVALSANELPLDPSEVAAMTPAQVASMPDDQLRAAIDALTGATPSTSPS